MNNISIVNVLSVKQNVFHEFAEHPQGRMTQNVTRGAESDGHAKDHWGVGAGQRKPMIPYDLSSGSATRVIVIGMPFVCHKPLDMMRACKMSLKKTDRVARMHCLRYRPIRT